MSNEEILHYNIPTATPFVYEFDKDLNPLRYYYLLGDDLTEEDIARKEEEVAAQGRVGEKIQDINIKVTRQFL